MYELEVPTVGATLDAMECALIVGVKPATWRAMVVRRQAPPACGWDPETGRRVWNATEVLKWKAARPGKGNWETGRSRRLPGSRDRTDTKRTYSFGKLAAKRPSKYFYPTPKKKLPPRLPPLP